jgi:tRNA (adenine57-N1/adenine58-N1)-methyltransferase
VVLPQLKRRASKSDFSDEDVEIWTPGALGERTTSAKKARKTARAAQAAAALATGAESGPELPST